MRFVKKSWTALLPIPKVKIPEAVQIAAHEAGLVAKQEFHVMIVGYVGARALKNTPGASRKLGEYQNLLRGSWHAARRPEFWLVEKTYEAKRRRTIIQAVELDAVKDLYDRLNRLFGTELPAIWPHTTLYTLPNTDGIGINSMEEFKLLNPIKIKF